MPTYRQKLVASKIMENRGNISKSMIEAGYSETTAKNPKNLTNSKSWTDLMEKYVKEDDLAKIHKFMLFSRKLSHYDFPLEEDEKEIKEIINSIPNAKLISIRRYDKYKRAYFSTPDMEYIDKALDKAYKIKGRYKNSLIVEQNKEEEYLREIVVRLWKVYSSKRGTVVN